MIEKPEPVSEVALDHIIRNTNVIFFYSTPDALASFRDFGNIENSVRHDNLYILWVDKRFDFEEVVEYIRLYG